MKDANKAEMKQQNRKAMPKFIVIMTLSVLIGGAFGFCASYYGLNGFAGKLTAAGTYFSSRMAHWLLLALAAILAISALVFGTGALPSLAVCAVWMVMQCVYSREAMRLSRAGSQITE